LPPVGFDPGVTVVHGQRRVRVFDYVPNSNGMGPLVVEINGTTVGLIHFARSNRPEAGSGLRRIRSLAAVPITLVSRRSEADTAALAIRLGTDNHKGDCSLEDTARLLRACRDRGLRTAFIGHGGRQALAAAEAHVSIALVDESDEPPEYASTLLLQPRWDVLADLWEIARAHEGRIRDTQKLMVVPNVFCVAGAFLFGFTGLVAVLISNAGTFSLYNRAVGSLRALAPAGYGRSQHPSLSR
jgi:Cu2+-exporting ATPase